MPAYPYGNRIVPNDYEHDTGVQMIFDTLVDRGFEPNELKEKIDAYEGDLWNEFFGPLLDSIEVALGYTDDDVGDDAS